jgi:RNA polymerase sigma-70 factor (ECF subfamily)
MVLLTSHNTIFSTYAQEGHPHLGADSSFQDLMARLRRGDDSAAATIFHRFTGRLTALARHHLDSRLRQKVDPEDVLQSAYKSFFCRQADGSRAPSDWNELWALLTVLTVRKCIRYRERFTAACRDVRVEAAPPPGDSSLSDWQFLDREPMPEEGVMLAEAVERLLQGLDDRDRDIVTLALQSYSAAEIGAQLNRPRRTIYRVLERIQKRLQRMQEENTESI